MNQQHTMLGVKGTIHYGGADTDGLIRSQCFTSEWRRLKKNERIRVTVRFDDHCNNGHEDLALTADSEWRSSQKAPWCEAGGGCMHGEIAKVFPSLEHLIPYHLMSMDGPMHYVANTLYHAGDMDHNGGKKGEAQSIIYHIENGDGFLLSEHPDEGGWSSPKLMTFSTYEGAKAKQDETGGNIRPHIQAYHDGKERELDAARRSACWPEATDEELKQGKVELAMQLRRRLPALQSHFYELVRLTGLVIPQMYGLAQDEKVRSWHRTEDEAFMQLQKVQGQSADWAMKHEGWTITPLFGA